MAMMSSLQYLLLLLLLMVVITTAQGACKLAFTYLVHTVKVCRL